MALIALKRLLPLIVIFVTFFLLVTGIRFWQKNDRLPRNFSELWPLGPTEENSGFTATEHSPLNLGDVEILSRINQEYARLTRAVVPSVVSIDTAGIRTERRLDPWGRARYRNFPTQGQGSGVIVSEEGHIVTNHHVIAGQQKLRITVHGGKTYPATMIGEDPLLDIAVIKINSNEKFTPLKLGDSSRVEVGQIVFAIGNPFGLGETVTQGIISAKERSLSDNQRDLFQTDAAINPGNSGGPLVNLMGEIIGINVAIFSADRANPSFQGVGFSIPSNEVRNALDQIITRGRTVRGFLGVEMRDLDEATRLELSYPEPLGSIVLSTQPDSPAQKAGLAPGDIVQTYNGRKVTDTRQLIRFVQSSQIGEKIKLGIWRNGSNTTLEATISEATPELLSRASQAPTQMVKSLEVLRAVGVEVRNLSIQEKMSGFTGVVVSNLLSQGLAVEHLVRGDLLMSINGKEIRSREEFYTSLAKIAATEEVKLRVMRNGAETTVTLPRLKIH